MFRRSDHDKRGWTNCLQEHNGRKTGAGLSEHASYHSVNSVWLMISSSDRIDGSTPLLKISFASRYITLVDIKFLYWFIKIRCIITHQIPMKSLKHVWTSLNLPSGNTKMMHSKLSMIRLINRKNSKSIKSENKPPVEMKTSLDAWKTISKLQKKYSKAENSMNAACLKWKSDSIWLKKFKKKPKPNWKPKGPIPKNTRLYWRNWLSRD